MSLFLFFVFFVKVFFCEFLLLFGVSFFFILLWLLFLFLKEDNVENFLFVGLCKILLEFMGIILFWNINLGFLEFWGDFFVFFVVFLYGKLFLFKWSIGVGFWKFILFVDWLWFRFDLVLRLCIMEELSFGGICCGCMVLDLLGFIFSLCRVLELRFLIFNVLNGFGIVISFVFFLMILFMEMIIFDMIVSLIIM